MESSGTFSAVGMVHIYDAPTHLTIACYDSNFQAVTLVGAQWWVSAVGS